LKLNRDLIAVLEEDKENKDERYRRELMKIWKNSRNKFTLERAIRGVYDKLSKEVSV
jgi:hypothetical protein